MAHMQAAYFELRAGVECLLHWWLIALGGVGLLLDTVHNTTHAHMRGLGEGPLDSPVECQRVSVCVT